MAAMPEGVTLITPLYVHKAGPPSSKPFCPNTHITELYCLLDVTFM